MRDGSVIPPLQVRICFWSSAAWPPTTCTCSDSGERCGVKQAMILRTDPHYLNAWNRLALQPLMSFWLNPPSMNKAFSVNLRIYELIAWQENSTGPRVPTGLFLLFLFLSFFHFPVFCALWLSSIKQCKKFVRDPFHWLLDYAGKLAVFALSLPAYTLFQKWWQVVNSFVFITIGPYCLLSRLKFLAIEAKKAN